MSNTIVPRFRWSDPDGASTSLDWRCQAVILATVFLNLAFFYQYGFVLWLPGPFVYTAAALVGTGVVFTVLFFTGPASLNIEECLGARLGLVVRVCGIVFLAQFVASMVNWSAGRLLPFALEGRATNLQASAATVAVLTLLCLTSLQSPRATAKMALFTAKLAVALLIAAFVRTRDGLPALAVGFPEKMNGNLFQPMSYLASYAVPILVLSSNKARGEHASRIAIWGVLLPCTLALVANSAIGLATAHSVYYQPSLHPTITMALWSHTRASYTTGFIMIAALSVFGAARFGLQMLTEEVKMLVPSKLGRAVVSAFVAAIILWQARDYTFGAPWVNEFCIVGLAATAGVLTASRFTRRCREARSRADFGGTLALLAGWTTPLYLRSILYAKPYDDWCHPAILPAYFVTFVVAIVIGLASRATQTSAGS